MPDFGTATKAIKVIIHFYSFYIFCFGFSSASLQLEVFDVSLLKTRNHFATRFAPCLVAGKTLEQRCNESSYDHLTFGFYCESCWEDVRLIKWNFKQWYVYSNDSAWNISRNCQEDNCFSLTSNTKISRWDFLSFTQS